MKQCAIILNGNDVITVTNLKRKYNKLVNNPNIKILEECDKEQLEEKYDYWKRTINKDPEKENEFESNLFYYKNKKTGETIISIYPSMEFMKSYIKDWEIYERDITKNPE